MWKNLKNHLRSSKKLHILLISLILLLGMTIIGSMAFLLDTSNEVENIFTPAHVTAEIKEDFSNNVKTNVYVHNTSDIDAYVRVTLVEYWEKGDKIVPKPAGAERIITWNSEKDSYWKDIGGIFYYKNVLKADNEDGNLAQDEDDTKTLIDKVEVKNVPSNYTYHLDIHIEAIQADGTNSDGISPLQLYWGVDAAEWVGIYKAN